MFGRLTGRESGQPTLFIGNFDFEHRLANDGWNSPAALIRRNAELSLAWLCAARSGDWLWQPDGSAIEVIGGESPDQWSIGRTVRDWRMIEVPVVLEPWGWSRSWHGEASSRHGVPKPPSWEVVRLVNGRDYRALLEQNLFADSPGTPVIVRDVDELGTVFGELGTDLGWVVKSRWGMSGRQQRRGCGMPDERVRAWMVERIRREGAVVVEPWLQIVAEGGAQWLLPAEGEPVWLGLTELEVDPRGQPRGCWTAAKPGSLWTDDWQAETREATRRVARRVQADGYFGPLGIDVALTGEDGAELRLRPLQDLNARWTMGRLALEGSRWLYEGEVGLLWLDAADPVATNFAGHLIHEKALTSCGNSERQTIVGPRFLAIEKQVSACRPR
jgi:hypothetical protein